MKRERVKLTPEQREIACRVMGDTLKKLGVEVIDWCVGAKHFHGLARFTPLGKWRDWDLPRIMVGKAKGVRTGSDGWSVGKAVQGEADRRSCASVEPCKVHPGPRKTRRCGVFIDPEA
jgi:hypothetical protein